MNTQDTAAPYGAGPVTTGTVPAGSIVGPNADPAIVPPPVRVFRTVDQLVQEHPEFKYGQIRQMLFNREKNGLQESGAVVRIGRRLLLERDLFLEWVWQQGQGAA